MAWHKWAFYTSLALWVVAVVFVAPEAPEKRHSFSRPRHAATWSFHWRNIVVTLICAGIMCLGYSKLCLYLDEMSDALASARTSHDPYRVYGVNAPNPDETTTVTRGLVDCHDRTAAFVTNYAQDFQMVQEEVRDNVRQMVDDVSNWNIEIGKVMREMKTEHHSTLLLSGSRENLLKRSHSADDIWPKEITTPTATSHGSPAFDIRTPPLFARTRPTLRAVSPMKVEHGAHEVHQRDRETTEVDVHHPALVADTFRGHSRVKPLVGINREEATQGEPRFKTEQLVKTNIFPPGATGASDHKVPLTKVTEDISAPSRRPVPKVESDAPSRSGLESEVSQESSSTSEAGTTATLKVKGKDVSKSEEPSLEVKEKGKEDHEKELDERSESIRATDNKEAEMDPKGKINEEPTACGGRASTLLARELRTDDKMLTVQGFAPEPSGTFDSQRREANHELNKTPQVPETSAPEESSRQGRPGVRTGASTGTYTRHEQENAKQT